MNKQVTLSLINLQYASMTRIRIILREYKGACTVVELLICSQILSFLMPSFFRLHTKPNSAQVKVIYFSVISYFYAVVVLFHTSFAGTLRITETHRWTLHYFEKY